MAADSLAATLLLAVGRHLVLHRDQVAHSLWAVDTERLGQKDHSLGEGRVSGVSHTFIARYTGVTDPRSRSPSTVLYSTVQYGTVRTVRYGTAR